MEAFEISHPKRLGGTVVFGYCDIGAAGIRVLEGLSGASAKTDGAARLRETGRETLTFSGMGGSVFESLPAFEAVHFDEGILSRGDQNSQPAVTLLKLNAEVREDLAASLSISLVDLLAAHGSSLDRLIIAAAVQPPKRHKLPATAAFIPPDVVCTFTCGGHRGGGAESSSAEGLPGSLSGLPALPTGARLADPFLTTLVRLCELEDLPLTLLARVGYRATGAAADVDGTDEAINDLGQVLAKAVGLNFSLAKACGARRSKGWKAAEPAQLVPGYI